MNKRMGFQIKQWTDERVLYIKSLFDDGYGYSEIGALLGLSRTRAHHIVCQGIRIERKKKD